MTIASSPSPQPNLVQPVVRQVGSSQEVRGSATRALLVLGAKALALALGVLLALVAFMTLVPDGNDYALATVLKHERLEGGAGRKVVFVGGSNLAYGLDSAMVEQVTGLHAVNMGMNGYFGVRFMLEEVKPALKPGDLVVLAFEYDSFVKSVDGSGTDLLMVAKARPRNLANLSWAQRIDILGALPFAAQQKMLRVTREGLRALRGTPAARANAEGPAHVDVDNIETLAGFNRYGDLTSHLGVTWTTPRELGLDLTALPLDPALVPLLRDFASEMKAREVTVWLSYGPVLRSFYEAHRDAVGSFHDALKQAEPLQLMSVPSDFVFEEPYFFDTVYHLTAEGRARRTAKIIEQLTAHAALRGAH